MPSRRNGGGTAELIPAYDVSASLEVHFVVVNRGPRGGEMELHSMPAIDIGPETIKNKALLQALELARRAFVIGWHQGPPLIEFYPDQGNGPEDDDGAVVLYETDMPRDLPGPNDIEYIRHYYEDYKPQQSAAGPKQGQRYGRRPVSVQPRYPAGYRTRRKGRK